MACRRLVGERVVVKVSGCGQREGVLISGVKKETESIQKFPVRFPNGDVRTYRGDQLLLRGKQAPLMEFICVGDVLFTKQTLGVVRFIGLHEDYVGTVIVIEPIDPKLPTDPNVDSFRKQFPSASLSDSRAYNILRKREEILKILPPDVLLLQLSKIKDKYLAFLEESRETSRAFKEEMGWRTKKINDIENDISEQEKEHIVADSTSDAIASHQDVSGESNSVQLLFDPGKLGIKALWETGKIEGVSAGLQAEKLGVQVGWIIAKVDGEDYSEEILDSKVAGDVRYTLTFKAETNNDDINNVTASEQLEQTILPPNSEVPLKEFITAESEREKYERKIRELKEQVEDFQYAIEDLQTKNSNLENEHKELPNLRTKVKQLRSSKVMFQGQIKEVQKRQKDWKKKAEEHEKEYKKMQKPSYNKKLLKKGQGSFKERKQQGKHAGRRPAGMPRPDLSNTVSLSSRSLPNIGDGSSETLSLSNLKDTDKKNNKRNNNKKKPRKSWFGNNNRN